MNLLLDNHEKKIKQNGSDPLLSARELADSDHEQQFIAQEDTDVVFITVDNKKIGAHSYMLKARSSVLRANLKTNWVKGNEIRAYFRYETLYEMLRFIYASKVERLTEFAEDLLKAADMYDLQSLKLVCESELIKGLHKNNSISSYLLACTYGNKALEAKAIEMINNHSRELVNTKDWARLKPEHIMEFYYAMIHLSAPAPKQPSNRLSAPAQKQPPNFFFTVRTNY